VKLIEYKETVPSRNEEVMELKSTLTLYDAVNSWLEVLGPSTRRSYSIAWSQFGKRGILDLYCSLNEVASIDFEGVVDYIKQIPDWTESTRQVRAAAVISFTRWLSRRSKGTIKAALPVTCGPNRTFYEIREKCLTPAMNRAQWSAWLIQLRAINPRYWMLGAVQLQGGKRISEALDLLIEDIDWENKRIRFAQKKRGKKLVHTVITYPDHVLKVMRDHLKTRNEEGIGIGSPYFFLDRFGNRMYYQQVRYAYITAGVRAGIPFTVNTHVLRASCVTYLRDQGFPDHEIMGVTGHTTIKALNAYDKREMFRNASEKVSLV